MFFFNLGQWRISIKQNIIVTLFMLTFSIIYMIESWNLSFESLLFPRFLFICIAITGSLSIKKFVQISKVQDTTNEENNSDIHNFNPSKKLLLFILVTFLMILFSKILGIVLVSVIFLFVTMYFGGVNKISLLILVPIFTTGVIYGVFKVWLSVPLPVGILGF